MPAADTNSSIARDNCVMFEPSTTMLPVFVYEVLRREHATQCISDDRCTRVVTYGVPCGCPTGVPLSGGTHCRGSFRSHDRSNGDGAPFAIVQYYRAQLSTCSSVVLVRQVMYRREVSTVRM